MHKARSTTKHLGGFSIVEAILATSIFGLMVTSLMGIYFYSIRSVSVSGDRVRAIMLAQEGIEAVKNIRDTGFHTLSDGTYGLSTQSNIWEFSGDHDTTDIYERHIDISTLDASTKMVTSVVTWPSRGETPHTVTLSQLFTLWKSKTFFDTTTSDFSAGTMTDIVQGSSGNGDLRLSTVSYGDWCDPSGYHTQIDIPGAAFARTVTTVPGKLMIGTGTNETGLALISNSITSGNNPSISPLGTYDGESPNALTMDDNYVYLATNNDTEEVVILSLAQIPYTRTGWFDVPGGADATSVSVRGDIGYVISGNTLYAFDITSKIGTRNQVGNTVTLPAIGTAMTLVGDYAYIALDSTTTQMVVVNISDINAMTSVAQAEVSGMGGIDVSVSTDGNRAYLVSQESSSFDELFVIDTTSKSGTLSLVSSHDANGMNPRGVRAVSGSRVIVAGNGGSHQYIVFDMFNETTPTICSGLQLSGNVLGFTTINDFENNAYAYVITDDPLHELSIFRGGPGSVGGNTINYALSGTYTSRVFDTGKTSYFPLLSWSQVLPDHTSIGFQVRSGDSSDLSNETWYGPDGTSLSTFSDETGDLVPSVVQNKRYIQYRALYTSDGTDTPILTNIRLYYE